MARNHFRVTAAVGALGLGLLAMSPAVAATDHQAGANAFSIEVAGQGPQGTGLSTAKYENGQETKSGEIKPPFPQPAQDNFKLGVLVQEATAGPDGSAACAGLGGDGKGQITIGDSSCLKPGNNLTGSLGGLDLDSLLSADSASAITDALGQVPGSAQLLDAISGGQTTLTQAIQTGLAQAAGEFGDGGLVVDLDAIEGRCTATDGSATGSATLTNARIALSGGGQDVTLLDLPTDPDPNTHLTTDLSKVVKLLLDAVKTDLQSTLGNQGGQLQDVIDQIETPLVDNIHAQVEKNLAPLEQNVLDVTLNWQQHPTADSIKVRALNVDVLPALKDQLKGKPLVNLQIGNAACAPVASAVVSPPQASTPKVSNPKTPTGVSAGLGSVPDSGAHQGIDPSTWALMALAGLGLSGAGLVGARRLFN